MRPLDECLLHKRKGGVVTDGLLFWLDASDDCLKVTPTYDGYKSVIFTDRISGSDVTFAPISTAENARIVLDGGAVTTKYASGATAVLASSVSGIKTVEIVAKVSANRVDIFDKLAIGQRVFYPFYSSSTGAKIETGNAATSATAHTVGTGNETDGNPILYQNGTSVYTVVGSSAYAVDAFDSCTVISGDFDVLYSVRLYDRYLSESEILQNYNYEKSLGRIE